ncbi:MAG: AAA family ATPase [Coriobacteriales bacterium]|nr:AAA family ATPase [Coriobacteriales bacterium]
MLSSLPIKALRIDWDEVGKESYLRSIPALAELDELTFSAPVTFFAGENGSGKSTLLEAIAVSCGFNPEGGTRNYRFSTYDSHSALGEALQLSRGVRRVARGFFLRAESFYNVATMEEAYSRGPGGRPQHFHERSHGESFLALAQNSFGANGIYLLDEPEAALSPQRLLALMLEIDRCVKAGSQFIIATHSPILMAMPGAEIVSFDGTIHACALEETQSWQLTSLFINHRAQVLDKLFDDGRRADG